MPEPTMNARAGDTPPNLVETAEKQGRGESAGEDGSTQIGPTGRPGYAWRPWVSLAIAAAVPCALFLFLPPLSKIPMWDPYELNVADLSRRIALHLYHGSGLALEGADNTLPHLNDLGRPQLPFSSIALGFKVFGLAEWAGRLPLALWGWLGALATYAFASRLFDRRTGVYASVVLSTMPLYCLEARTMLGDVCTMAALAMSFGGLAVTMFDRHAGGVPSLARRAPWLLLGLVGLLAGFESRGALLGIGAPLLTIGLAWAIARVGAARSARDRIGDVLGVLALTLGVIVAFAAANSVSIGKGKDLDFWIGSIVQPPSRYPTFDLYIGAIGHALAPWSAFVPLALGRMVAGPVGVTGAAAERESLARVALIVGAGVLFVAHAYLAAYTDFVAFSAPALLAVMCAVAIRDFERGARASIFVGVGTLLLAAVIHHDFHEIPEKAYQAYGVSGARFPDAFKDTALTLWWIALGGVALGTLLTWAETDVRREPFEPARYAEIVRRLRDTYDGALELVYLAAIAGLTLAAAIIRFGTAVHWHRLPPLSTTVRDVLLNAWWVVALGPLGFVFGPLFASDLWVWTFQKGRRLLPESLMRGFEPFEAFVAHVRRPTGETPAMRNADEWIGTVIVGALLFVAVPGAAWLVASAAGVRPLAAAALAVPSGFALFLVLGVLGNVFRHRAVAQVLVGGAAGLVVCFAYYPALASRLSPKEAFDSYRRECAGSPLALLGVGSRAAAYYSSRQPHTANDPAGAMDWLLGGGDERRCLIAKSDDLPKLNQLWLERGREPRVNLPVLDARQSPVLLIASSLKPSERNENPLSSILLEAPPRPQRPLSVNLDDKVQLLGIDLVDEQNRAVATIGAGRTYHMKAYYRVLDKIQDWPNAFIHIDGSGRRYNVDHKPMNGRYPMSLWLPGDMPVDDQEFKLPANFTPGMYTIYFGLASGDGCNDRLKVKTGPTDGCNRINAGAVRVQ